MNIETRFRRLAMAAALVGLFSYAAVLTITQALISEMGRYYNITPSRLSILYLAQMAGFLVAALWAGSYSDKHGKLPVILGGSIVMTIGTLILGWPSTFPQAILAVLLTGIGGGAVEITAMAIVVDLYGGPRRTAMLNCSQALFGVGAILTPITISALLHAGIKWQYGFIGVGISCAISSVLAYCAYIMHHEKPVGSHEETANWRELLSNRLVLWLSIGLMLYVGAECGTASWLTAYFERYLGSAPYLAAFSPACFWIGITAGRLVGAGMARYMTEITLTRWCLAAAALCQATLLILNHSTPGFIATLCLGLFLGPIYPTVVSYAGAKYPKSSGTVFAIIAAFGAVGNAVFTPAIGGLADAIGMRPALWTCFVLLIINLNIFLRIKKRESA